MAFRLAVTLLYVSSIVAENCPGTSIAASNGWCCKDQATTNVAPAVNGASCSCVVGGPCVKVGGGNNVAAVAAVAPAAAADNSMSNAAAAAAMAGKPFIPNFHGGGRGGAAAAAMAGKPFIPNVHGGGRGGASGNCKSPPPTINGFNCKHCCPDECEDSHPECLKGGAVHKSEVKVASGNCKSPPQTINGFNCKHCCPDECEDSHPECLVQLLSSDGELARAHKSSAESTALIAGGVLAAVGSVALFAAIRNRKQQASLETAPLSAQL